VSAPTQPRRRALFSTAQPGFTLIELAVGLLVLSLLLATLLGPLTAQVDQKKISDTQATLNQISEALIGFAMSRGYLPCPDKTAGAAGGVNNTPNDGNEDFVGANCVVSEGNLPWATLGISGTDAWGNFFRYNVTPLFAQRPKAITLASGANANITVVCPAPACNPQITYTSAGNLAPALVMSHGKNGAGAINATTRALMPAPTSGNEITNATLPAGFGDAKTFNIRPATAASGATTEFDDVVVWLSTPILLSRMVTAQQLP
jgi:prepilin-type N-terminal cleavage/methylation domain-containing protein